MELGHVWQGGSWSLPTGDTPQLDRRSAPPSREFPDNCGHFARQAPRTAYPRMLRARCPAASVSPFRRPTVPQSRPLRVPASRCPAVSLSPSPTSHRLPDKIIPTDPITYSLPPGRSTTPPLYWMCVGPSPARPLPPNRLMGKDFGCQSVF